MRLLARMSDETGTDQIYLSRPDLVKKYLDKGWEVFEVSDNGTEIPVTDADNLPENRQQSSTSEAVQALDIIMNGG